jgi:hypothetical protein
MPIRVVVRGLDLIATIRCMVWGESERSGRNSSEEDKEVRTVTTTTNITVTGEQKISCEQRIDRALRRLRGVRYVEANVESQRVVVTLDPTQVGTVRSTESSGTARLQG